MNAARIAALTVFMLVAAPLQAQVAPTAAEAPAYQGLHAAAQRGDLAAIRRLAADRAALQARAEGRCCA